MASSYFGQDLVFLRKLREARQSQLLALEGQASSIAAAGYSKSKTNLSLADLKKDLQELQTEITRQEDIENGTVTRPTCSFADFTGAYER